MKFKLFIILFVCMFLVNCSNPRKASIYYNETFEHVCSLANKSKEAFCVVLVDSTQRLSQKYLLNLNNTNLVSENKVIYNILDINSLSNEWYMKWLCPVSLPLTCVFSSDGVLIDLIPGATKETFLYTKEILSSLTMTKFHYPNRFNLSKARIIPLLNQILECKTNLDQGIYIPTILNNSIDSLKYPYPYYLKIIGGLMEEDTVKLRAVADSMIELENPYYLELFRKEFIVAKKILNPYFNINNEPNIIVNKNQISLKGKIDKDISFAISICNDGGQPLNILKIFTSCSCLKQIDHVEEFVITPKDSVWVKFNFKSEEQGEVVRDIFITSNAINKPILYVKVLADIS